METQLAGFMKNRITGEYELMFWTFIGSPLLVKERSIEKANERNKFSGTDTYDTDDFILRKREVITTYSKWEPVEVT